MTRLSALFRRKPIGADPGHDGRPRAPGGEGFDAVLHVGAGKTGSSAIQSFIADNQEALGRLGFAVPSAEFEIGPPASAAHVTPFERYFAADGAGLTPRLEAMMATRRHRTVLISAENLCERHGYLEEFCRKFNVKVILYIRRQDEYLESAWQQWHSKTRSNLREWLDYMLALDVIRWDATVDKWASIAGPGNVVPRVFDRLLFPDGHVSKDFLAALGGAGSEAEFTFRAQDSNVSWSNILTSVVAGRTDVFADVHDDAFYRYVGRLTGDRYARGRDVSLISRRDRERILAHYGPGNERLRASHFPERPSLFAPLDHSHYRYEDDIDLAREQVRVLTDLVVSAFKMHRT